MTITRAQAAAQLDVTIETIDTIVGQFDDPDLYDGDGDVITADGMELLRDQLGSSEPIGEDLLAQVAEAAAAAARATDQVAEAAAARDAAIRAAVAYGHRRTEVARRAGISRERLYQIIAGQ